MHKYKLIRIKQGALLLNSVRFSDTAEKKSKKTFGRKYIEVMLEAVNLVIDKTRENFTGCRRSQGHQASDLGSVSGQVVK